MMVYLFYKKGFFMLKKLHSNMSYLFLCLCLMPLMAVTQENQDQGIHKETDTEKLEQMHD